MGPFFAGLGKFIAAIFVGAKAAGVAEITAGYVLAVNLARIGLLAVIAKLTAPKLDLTRQANSKKLTINDSIAPQKFIYGEDMVSGPLLFANVAGIQNRDLYFLVALVGHECDSFTKYRIDDVNVQVGQLSGAEDGDVTGGVFSGVARVDRRLGTSTQVVIPSLTSVFGSEFNSAHTGRGWAYMLWEFNIILGSEDVFKRQPRNLRAVIKGKIVYDPRLDTGGAGDDPTNAAFAAWSDNPALCLADFIRDDKFGMKEEDDRIDWDMVETAADICDELVAIPTAATQKRYTCNATFLSTQRRSEVRDELLGSMMGRMVFSQGLWKMWAGAAVTADVTLTEANLAGGIQMQVSTPSQERYNRVRGKYINANKDYTATTYPEARSSTFVTEDGGEVREQVADFTSTNNDFEAQRKAIITLRQSRNQRVVVFQGNYSCFRIQAGSTVDLDIAEYGFAGEKFFVTQWSLTQDGVELTLVEEVDSVWTAPIEGDYTVRTATGTLVFGDTGVPAPTSLTATGKRDGVLAQWVKPPKGTYDYFEVHASDTNVRGDAIIIAETKAKRWKEFIIEQERRTRYYWVRSVNKFGQVSDFEPDLTTTTASAEPTDPIRSWMADSEFDLTDVTPPSEYWDIDENQGASPVQTGSILLNVGGGLDGSNAMDFKPSNGFLSSFLMTSTKFQRANNQPSLWYLSFRYQTIGSADSDDHEQFRFSARYYWNGIHGTSSFSTTVDIPRSSDWRDFDIVVTGAQSNDRSLEKIEFSFGQRFPVAATSTLDTLSIDFMYVERASGPFGNIDDASSGKAAGAVPKALSGDSGKFLQGDGTWQTPAGSGNVSNVGTPVDNEIAVWKTATTIEGDPSLTWNGTNQLKIESALPQIHMFEDDQAADEGRWRFSVTGSTFRMAARSDDNTTGNTVFDILRTGNAIDEARWLPPLFTLASNTPRLMFEELDQALDEKKWRFQGVGSNFALAARDDADAAGVNVFTVNRGTGTAIDNMTISVPLLATSYDGVLAADLVDKGATETITGAWTLPVASITAHEAALTILETQITDGSLLARLAAAETIAGVWTFSDVLITQASDTAAASIRLPHGAAPTSPVNGDLWTTTGSMFVRINGVTQDVLAGSVPTLITVADESADTTCFPAFFTAATGDLGPKTGTNLIFDSSTGDLIATLFAGIANADLVDKGDTETITGAWTLPVASITAHEAALTITEGQITDGSILARVGAAENITAIWTFNAGLDLSDGDNLRFGTGNDVVIDFTGTNFVMVGSGDWNITGFGSINAGTVDADFDAITATSYEGILAANMVDATGAFHDGFSDFLAAEHVDWAAGGAGTIHTDNYIENATHTGQVTGATALTLVVAAITGQTDIGANLVGTDEIIVSDGGVIRRADISRFNNYFDANLNFTNNAGTVTSIGITPGALIDVSGSPVTVSGNITVDVDLSELTDMTAAALTTDEMVLLDAGLQRRKAFSEINLSIFNDDLGHVENVTHTGEVTGATTLTIAADAVTYAKMQNVVADERLLGNVSGAGGIVAELTQAQVITFLGIEAGATADQTSIVGITGTKAQFDTAVTDGNIAYVGGAFHDGFSDFVANEHLDWTADQGASNIHVNNITSVVAGVVTAHEAALTILETQITDGALFGRLAATETVVGLWTFQAGLNLGDNDEVRFGDAQDITMEWTGTAFDIRGATNSQQWNLFDGPFIRIWDDGNTDWVEFSHSGTDFTITGFQTTDIDITGFTSIKATGVDAAFKDITGATFATIAANDLVDKSAVETIAGVWTHSALLITDAPDATAAGLRLPHGTAPTSPINGDLWTTTTSIFARINGVTQDLQVAGGTPTLITVADESSDTTCFPAFFTAQTGDLGPKTAGGMTFNSATDDFNSTLIAGIANANLLDKAAAETVSASWIFSAATALKISNGTPRILYEETDGGTDAKLWDLRCASETFKLRTRTDADDTGNDYFTAQRVGTTASRFVINAPVQLSPENTKYRAGPASRSSNTLSDDGTLAGWVLDADSCYKVAGYLKVNSDDGVPDFKCDFQTSQTPITSLLTFTSITSTAAAINDTLQFDATMNIATGTAGRGIHIIGLIDTHATLATTVDFRWACQDGGAEETTLGASSWITFMRLGAS